MERKKKQCKKCKKPKYIKGYGLCEYCYNYDYARKQKNKKQRNSYKKKTRKKAAVSQKSRLIVDVDVIVSRLVRIGAADHRGVVKCYTCDKEGYWKFGGIECGHYIPRGRMSLRWSFDNLRPQCVECNRALGGNLEEYRNRLIKETSLEEVQGLEFEGHQIKIWTNDELRNMKKQLGSRLAKLRKDKKL